MSENERAQILKMVEEGKITPEQAVALMNALNDPVEEDVPPSDEPASQPEPEQAHPEPDPEFDRKIGRFRQLWVIPLGVGVIATVLGAYWMYSAMLKSGFGFWFLCSWVPFALGVVVVALSAVTKNTRWIYVNVKQKPGERPQRIVIAFPIPISLLRWGIKNFGHNIPVEHREQADIAMKAIFEEDAFKEPLFVDVHDEDGEHVQVYIG
jgi:hypothetical protein